LSPWHPIAGFHITTKFCIPSSIEKEKRNFTWLWEQSQGHGKHNSSDTRFPCQINGLQEAILNIVEKNLVSILKKCGNCTCIASPSLQNLDTATGYNQNRVGLV